VSSATSITTGAVQRVAIERRVSPNSTVQLIAFDATLRRVHQSRVEVTDHPVEDGSTVTDHSRRLPKRLQLDIIVTNDPVIVDAVENAQPSVAGGDPKSRAQDAWAALEDAQERGDLLTVRTWLKDYESMILEDMNAPRDAATGNVLSATISLRELITATTETVQPPDTVDKSQSPRTNLGRQNTTAAPAENESKARSVLSEVLF
jgi:hypothetical protein